MPTTSLGSAEDPCPAPVARLPTRPRRQWRRAAPRAALPILEKGDRVERQKSRGPLLFLDGALAQELVKHGLAEHWKKTRALVEGAKSHLTVGARLHESGTAHRLGRDFGRPSSISSQVDRAPSPRAPAPADTGGKNLPRLLRWAFVSPRFARAVGHHGQRGRLCGLARRGPLHDYKHKRGTVAQAARWRHRRRRACTSSLTPAHRPSEPWSLRQVRVCSSPSATMVDTAARWCCMAGFGNGRRKFAVDAFGEPVRSKRVAPVGVADPSDFWRLKLLSRAAAATSAARCWCAL